MTYFTKLALTTSLAAVFATGIAYADGHGPKKDKAHSEMSADMKDPAAKAVVKQQRAEDAMERAEELMEDGKPLQATRAGQTAVKNEIESEIAEQDAEMRAGTEMEVVTVEVDNPGARGENVSTMVDLNEGVDIAPNIQGEPVLVTCPEGTTPQPNGTCMITGDFEM